DPIAPVAPLDALERDLGPAVRVELDVVDGHDVRVLEGAVDPGLLEELLDAARVLGLRLERLEGELAPERLLFGQVDHAHAALAEDRLGDEATASTGEIALEPGEPHGLSRRRLRLDGAPQVLLDGGEVAAERGEDGLERLLHAFLLEPLRIL